MTRCLLLVIDIQRGAFDGQRCPPIDTPEPFLARARALVETAREGEHPIVFVQHCETTPGEVFEEGTPHWLLHEALQPDPARGSQERILKKYASSAFENTELDAWLQALDGGEPPELLVCGLQSEFCVSNTVRSALALGYAVQLAEDAHNTWPSAERSAAEIRAEVNAQLARAGARLASTEALSARLSRGAGSGLMDLPLP